VQKVTLKVINTRIEKGLKMTTYLIDDETRLHVAAGGHKYRLQFFTDSYPTPPWKDNDGAVPILWDSGEGVRDDGARGYDLNNPFEYLSDSKIARNLETLIQEFSARCYWTGRELFKTPAEFNAYLRAEYEESGLTIREMRRDWLESMLQEASTGEAGLRRLAALWTLAGVPAAVHISRGYSQGDYAANLAVAHPEAVKTWGFETPSGKPNFRQYKAQCPDDLKNAANLWGAWCWGGVVGFEVAHIDPGEWGGDELHPETVTPSDLNGLALCEEVETAWGFYPVNDQDYFPLDTNHAETISAAIEIADADAAHRVQLDADAYALELLAARPDLAPQWGGVQL
jgi:hypothetical protein